METKIVNPIIDELVLGEHIKSEKPHDLENQIYELFDKAGIADRVSEIPESSLKIVANGVVDLWMIDMNGKAIEQMDRDQVEKIGPVVEDGLQGIAATYHGDKEWLPDSVRSLVLAALEKDPEKHKHYKFMSEMNVLHYTLSLSRAGNRYHDAIDRRNLSGGSERLSFKEMVSVMKYFHERDKVTGELDKLVDKRLETTLNQLKPAPTEEE